jgi:hypothetical protein
VFTVNREIERNFEVHQKALVSGAFSIDQRFLLPKRPNPAWNLLARSFYELCHTWGIDRKHSFTSFHLLF